MFILHKNDDDNRIVDDISFIPRFSFKEYTHYAEIVYNETTLAFEKGDELLFTKTSDKKGFHIRPKAANAEDTIQFTNGELITKRTFWANKETIERLIKAYIGNNIEVAQKNRNNKRSRNSFRLLDLPVGTELSFLYDENVIVEVADDKNKIKYEEQIYTVSDLAKRLLKKYRNRSENSGVNGFEYFTKDGIPLSKLRDQIEGRMDLNTLE